MEVATARVSPLPINELACLSDVFCTDLVRVEVMRNLTRLVWAVEQQGPDGLRERSVNLKLLVPTEALAPCWEHIFVTLGGRVMTPWGVPRLSG